MGHQKTCVSEDALDRLDRCLSTDCDPVRVGAPHLSQYCCDCPGITRPIPEPIGQSSEEGLGRETVLAVGTARKGRRGGGDGSHRIRHLLLAFKMQPGFSSFVTPQTARFLDCVAWFT